jgi:Linear amide C-N hydrolases, choloylglycine hydrolase family
LNSILKFFFLRLHDCRTTFIGAREISPAIEDYSNVYGLLAHGRMWRFGQRALDGIRPGAQLTTIRAPPRRVMRSRTPDKTLARNGLQWTVNYGYVGMNILGLSSVVDGLNERGLSVGSLWLPGSEYQKVSDPGRALSVLLVNDWLLGTCASVADVMAALPTVEVWAYKPMEEKLDPIHFTVHDASGNSIVIETPPASRISPASCISMTIRLRPRPTRRSFPGISKTCAIMSA